MKFDEIESFLVKRLTVRLIKSDKNYHSNYLVYIYKYIYRVRHLTFFFSTSAYFVNGNT